MFRDRHYVPIPRGKAAGYGGVPDAAGIPPCGVRPLPNGTLGAAHSAAAGANAVERWAAKLLDEAHERFEAEYGEISGDECRRMAAAGWTRALRIATVGCELRVSYELVPPADTDA